MRIEVPIKNVFIKKSVTFISTNIITSVPKTPKHPKSARSWTILVSKLMPTAGSLTSNEF